MPSGATLTGGQMAYIAIIAIARLFIYFHLRWKEISPCWLRRSVVLPLFLYTWHLLHSVGAVVELLLGGDDATKCFPFDKMKITVFLMKTAAPGIGKISWLKEELQLIADPKETEMLAKSANPEDICIVVPAFTGLSAPYWRQDVKAALIGMGRITGKAEIVRAALHSIAFQINDVLKAMEKDTGCHGKKLRVDGGPTKNGYLMQFQSNLSDRKLLVSEREELSAKWAAYLAGITAGIYENKTVSGMEQYQVYVPFMEGAIRQRYCRNWENAVSLVLGSGDRDCGNT